ncbi:MAG: hypothetical protein E3J83_00570 [Candidatus Atribacteria bacterium]|nr:MAG: hypothetical protein E3J83_00570 [Candidatus Atribacteria bacterium]
MKIKIEEKNYFKNTNRGTILEKYDGLKLRPLFYSEISSSFMVYEIFYNHKIIAKEFIKNFFGLTIDQDITVIREKRYPQQGSVDIFLSFDSKGKKVDVPIEIKVHDYLSVKPDQIRTLYEAAKEELGDDNVYFIYLTQFNRDNILSESKVALPDSIKEFEDSLKEIPKSRLKHLNWEEFHKFVEPYKKSLPKEYVRILELHKTWMTAKSKEDIELNIIDVGIRGLPYYFPDVNIVIEKELPFGKIFIKDKKKILSVDLERCNTERLNKVLDIIKIFADSDNIDRNVKQVTRDDTLLAIRNFLKSLSENEENWHLLSFYSSLFNFVNNTDNLLLYGSGTRGFSIRVNIKRKGNISMCTLWASKKIDFSIKR